MPGRSAVGERIGEAIARSVLQHERDPDASLACPACGGALAFEDRSARPLSLWYSVTCAACGLAEIVHIPLGGPSAGAG